MLVCNLKLQMLRVASGRGPMGFILFRLSAFVLISQQMTTGATEYCRLRQIDGLYEM